MLTLIINGTERPISKFSELFTLYVCYNEEVVSQAIDTALTQGEHTPIPSLIFDYVDDHQAMSLELALESIKILYSNAIAIFFKQIQSWGLSHLEEVYQTANQEQAQPPLQDLLDKATTYVQDIQTTSEQYHLQKAIQVVLQIYIHLRLIEGLTENEAAKKTPYLVRSRLNDESQIADLNDPDDLKLKSYGQLLQEYEAIVQARHQDFEAIIQQAEQKYHFSPLQQLCARVVLTDNQLLEKFWNELEVAQKTPLDSQHRFVAELRVPAEKVIVCFVGQLTDFFPWFYPTYQLIIENKVAPVNFEALRYDKREREKFEPVEEISPEYLHAPVSKNPSTVFAASSSTQEAVSSWCAATPGLP